MKDSVTDCRELMDLVKSESRRMVDAQPTESAIGNMARRGLSALWCLLTLTRFCLPYPLCIVRTSWHCDNYNLNLRRWCNNMSRMNLSGYVVHVIIFS